MDSTNTSDSVNGRLVSKPGIPTKATLGPGVHTVGADGLLLVPRTAQSVTMPLIVILHGAGGEANQALRYLHTHTDDLDNLLLVVKSHGGTWDAIRGGFGTDVAALDAALAEVFDRFQVDGERVAIAGFSDGATYALSLGIITVISSRRSLRFHRALSSRARASRWALHTFSFRMAPRIACCRYPRRVVSLSHSSGRRDTKLIIVSSMAATPSHQPWRRLVCSKCR
jgi:predicted esterase